MTRDESALAGFSNRHRHRLTVSRSTRLARSSSHGVAQIPLDLRNVESVAPGCLRFVKRGVRRRAQALLRGSGRTVGDANAGGRNDHCLSCNGDRLAHFRNDFLGDDRSCFGKSGIVDKHRKFVAADSGNHVTCAHAAAEALGKHAQHFVACGVSESIVDRLEEVDIDVEQRQWIAAPAVSQDKLRKPFVELTAVRQPGQRIDPGQLLQLTAGLLQRFLCGDADTDIASGEQYIVNIGRCLVGMLRVIASIQT